MDTLNFTRLIGLIFIVSRLIQTAKTVNLSAIPTCFIDTTDGNTQINSSELCKTGNAGTSVPDGSVCIHSDKIYKSETDDENSSCDLIETIDTISSDKYILFSCDTSKCTVTSDDADPTGSPLLYHCTYGSGCTWQQNKIKFYKHNSKLYQCVGTSVCTIATDGYYLLTDTNSEETDSKIVKVTSGGPSDVTAGENTFYLDEENSNEGVYSKLIECSKNEDEEIVCSSDEAPSTGIFINAAISNAVGDALINCSTKTTCEKLTGVSNKYYVNALDSGLIKCDGTDGCINVTANLSSTGYYIDESSLVETSKYSKLISCSTETTCISEDATEGYYIDTVTSTNIISCTKGTDNKVKCSSNTHGGSETTPKHFYDPNSKQVITCTAKCILEDKTVKGYFLNSASSGGKIIKCTADSTTPCSIIGTDPTAFDGIGTVKYVSSGSKVYLCVANTCGDNDIEEIKGSVDKYVSLTITTAGKFPGAAAGTIAVKIGKDGTAILLEDGGLPACVAGECSENVFCWDADNKMIQTLKTGETGTCDSITISSDGTTLYYASDYSAIEEDDIGTTTPAFAYYCETTSSCDLLKGTIKNDDNYVQCSGWKRDDCIVSTSVPTSCTNEKEGVWMTLSTKPALCFKADQTNGLELPEDSTTTYALISTSDIIPSLGIKDSDTKLIALTSTSAIVISETTFTENSYYLNLSVSGTLENAIIICTDTTIDSCTKANASSGFYVNAGGDKTTKQLIECNDSGCKSVAGVVGYYIDASDQTKIIKCSGSDPITCDSDAHGATIQNHYLDNTSSGRVITCKSGGPCYFEDKAIKGYFLNSDSSATSKIITCSGTLPCTIPNTADASSCSKAGNIMVDNDTVSLCIIDSDANPIEIKDDGQDEPTYTTLTIEDDGFPGATAGKIAVKIGTDGTAILLEKPTDGLPTCGSITSNAECKDNASPSNVVNYCYKEGKIYKTTGSQCKTIVLSDIGASTAGSYAILFDSEGQQVADDSTNPNIFAYFCTFSSATALTSCSLVSGGYVIDKDGKVTQCSGWRREGCTIKVALSSLNCSAGNVLTINKDKKFCLGTDVVETTSTSIAVSPEEVNTIYGILPEDINYITISENSVLVDSSIAIVQGYQKNYAVINAKTKALIQCTGTTAGTCAVIDANSGYYLNVGGDKTDKQIIKCTETSGCVTEAVSTGNCVVGKTIVDSGKVKLCTTTTKTEAKELDSETAAYSTIKIATDGDFPDGKSANKFGIKIGTNVAYALEDASLPECTDVTNSAACKIGDDEIAEGVHCINNSKLYKTESNVCTQVETNGGSEGEKVISYFDTDYKEASISVGDTTEYLVYECSLDGSGKHEECTLIKGYTNNDPNYVQCSGWKGETCNVVASITEACAANGNGVLGTSKSNPSVCFGTDEAQNVNLPSDPNTATIAFTSINTSKEYGVLEEDVVILSLADKKSVVTVPTEEGYYLNYNGADDENNQIIQCSTTEGTTKCTAEVSKVGFYLDLGSKTVTKDDDNNEVINYSKLVKCTDENKVCTLEVDPDDGYYVDASSIQDPTAQAKRDGGAQTEQQTSKTTYSGLIKCEDGKCNSMESSDIEAGYYINAAPDTTDSLKMALIKCSGEDSVTCEVEDGANNKVLIDNGNIEDDGNGNTIKSLIQCYEDSTAENPSKGCESYLIERIGSTTDITVYFVNGDSSATLATGIIKCTTTCEPVEGHPNDVYLNGNLKKENSHSVDTNQLIVCYDSSCSSEASGLTAEGTEFYLNAGKYTDAQSKTYPLINCSIATGATTATCIDSDVTVKDDAPKNVYFINGNYNRDGKYLIDCSAADTCELYSSETPTVGVVEHYIHGSPNADDALKEAVIECTFSSPSAKREGAQTTTPPVASCGIISIIEPNSIFINSADGKLIQCISNTGCASFTTVVGAEDEPVYFVNSAVKTSDSYSDLIIKCTGTCTPVDAGEHNVYLNGNLKDAENNTTGEEDMPLIICSDKSCVPTAYTSSGSNNEYFVNAGGSEDKTNLDDKLIKCDSTPACSIKDNLSSVVTDLVKEVFFINKNYDDDHDNVNYLIRCDTTHGCEATGTVDPVKGSIEHYVHGSADGKENAIIEVTFSTPTASKKRETTATIKANPTIIAKATENSIYLNSSDAEKLIQCTASACAAYPGTGTDKIYAYYVNAAVAPPATPSDPADPERRKRSESESYTDAIIECTNAQCNLITPEPNDIFLNGNLNGATDGTTTNASEDTNQLIVCGGGVCVTKESQTETEEFFVNAGEYTDQSNNKLVLIRCYMETDVVKCDGAAVTLNGASEHFFINGNYNSDATEKRDTENYIIQCTSATSCSVTKKSAVKEGDVLHYVHGAPDATTKQVNAVIECKVGATEEGEEEVDPESQRRRRDVTGESTPATQDTVTETGTSTTSIPVACTLIPNAIGDGKESNIYINSSDPTQIIRCLTTSGCLAERNDSSNTNSAYYINEDIENESTNLIKCTSTDGCAILTSLVPATTEGQGNTTTTTTSSEEPKVFLNANYKIGRDTKHPLIKCSPSTAAGAEARKRSDDEGMTCELAESQAVKDLPEFYVNADRKSNLIDEYDGVLETDIIKCVSDKPGTESNSDDASQNETRDATATATTTLEVTCSVAHTPKAEDVYLNANFDVSKKQIIKCTQSKGCFEAPAYPEEEEEVVNTVERTEDDPDDEEVDDGNNDGSGSDSSNLIYYVNAGAVKQTKLEDTLIICRNKEDKCKIKVANAQEIYINANNQQLILCYADSGCVAKSSNASGDNNEFFLNSSDLENAQDPLTNDLIKCTLDGNTKKCEPFDGKPNKVYINSYNTSELIYCLDGVGCNVKPSKAIANRPEYYVNGDDIDFVSSAQTEVSRKRQTEEVTTSEESTEKDSKPLIGDLIECKMSGSSGIKCSVITGNLGDVYINSNYNKEDTDDDENPLGDTEHQLIKCSKTGCVVQKVEGDNLAELPEYYINSGNKATRKFDEALIMCSEADNACTLKQANVTQIYVNSNENQPDKPIIKCSKNNCSASVSGATKDSKEYYVNAGKITDTPLQYDIIECSIEESDNNALARRATNTDSSIVTCKCLSSDEVGIGSGIGVYLNSNYASDGNQLIQCSNDNGCVGVKSESTSKVMEYYVNAESSDSLNNAIIFCSNKKCEKQTPATVPMYYVGKDSTNDVDGLIECVSTPEQEPTPTSTTDADPTQTPTTAQRRKRGNVNKCTMKSAFTSQGYYLNSGYNKATNQTILCDSSDGCSTLKVDLGYYVNAGNSEKPIIKCEKEGSECSEEESPNCPSSADAIAGNYCYADNQLKFYPSTNSTAISASKSDDCYSFATIPVNGFPGIRTETGSLFKISRYFINRYYQGGVVMIDKNGKLVDTLTSDQSDISLYDCNDSTKICSERPGCTPNTYMFDAENRKVIFCNAGKMEYAQISGYVVDGTRVSGGSKHPYIIYCESNGEKCKSIKPKVSTYYENSGYDATSNSLIQCSNNNCHTVTAEAGYYVGHGEDGNSGIIKCTSATTCTYSQVKSKVKYVNAGSDKTSYAIIECTKTNGCSVAKAKTGYYLTYTSTLLIQCTSPTSCVEFTPTVNYYDNADSSESSSTIINCVQNSSVVTCATEATNNGFYMSSLSNVLIRCKAGSKCKTITVKNGIFRGALKGLTSSNKRSENDEKEEFVRKTKARDAEVDDLEESGKMVTLRDNDDAYGIIRCVAGKCSALSPTELAAIPMCEFNNNKCYITLEYAMTKSATTSISAGNICTNNDRSVFYFATDTIVVKPNVISGVTATYIYTTTNSNCLEVNDSYDDMYFTVGSNIYLLDQGSVLQFYETGYYFLNVAKNVLVKGNDIDAYNDENVKLYRCNGSSCSIVDKPESITYYADVNKRILKYNVNSDAYSFAYEKDITCIFANNKCTPNADMKSQEFCITYKGELVLATTDIKNRETGECYRASSISSTIYGYSQYLYNMNLYAAQMVDRTGYYIVSLSTNTTVVSKNYKTKNNSLVVYGCNLSSCKVYEPDEDTYYYDAQAKTILRYKDGAWNTPSTSGYAYISIDPTNTYIYKFSKNVDDIKIQSIANYGYYYTVDNEMYHCDQDEDGACTPIDDTGYYFTNSGEIYYCVHDSEELEATECTKQACVSGQYYFIDDAYYRCEVSSLLVPVVSRYCSYDDNVIINFPLALTEEFPDKIKQAVEGIQKNNNSTAIVSRRGKNYLEAVSGIFTNCTYNVEETKSTFDLVCVNNFVTVDKESDEVKICSIEQLGYIECIEDEDNPEKCHVSAAYLVMKPSLLVIFFVLLITTIQHLY